MLYVLVGVVPAFETVTVVVLVSEKAPDVIERVTVVPGRTDIFAPD